jgi:hypothetical protein
MNGPSYGAAYPAALLCVNTQGRLEPCIQPHHTLSKRHEDVAYQPAR